MTTPNLRTTLRDPHTIAIVVAVLVALVGTYIGLRGAPAGELQATGPTAEVLAQDNEAEPAEEEIEPEGIDNIDPDVVADIDATDVIVTRDPFDPNISALMESSADDGTVDGTSDGGDPDQTDDGTGTDTGSNGGSGSSDDGICQEGDAEARACDGLVVSLTGFDDQGRALITVGESNFAASAGDVFVSDGPYADLQVVSIEQPCVTFLYGDDGFTLCTGEQVLK